MTVVDDARLLELAARRPRDVFPILERAASLSPLVVVLTVLPGVVALQASTLSERDAQWRLKGLELSTMPSIFDAVDPAASSSVTVSNSSRLWAAGWSPRLTGRCLSMRTQCPSWNTFRRRA